MLQRRQTVKFLLDGRSDDLLAIAGLGSSAWDLAAAGESPRNFHFIGAMGQAAPFALGVSLAQAKKRVVLFTGDGEILMSLGVLATIANVRPKNLSIVILDNEAYAETGGQKTATAGVCDLRAIAQGAGFTNTLTIRQQLDLAALRDQIHNGTDLYFANIKISVEKLPLVFPPSFDGVTALNRFKAAAKR